MIKRAVLLLTSTLIFFFPHIAGAREHTPVRNVILMIGDGMGLGQIEIARQFEYGKTGELNLEKLEHTAFMRTYSADNRVTDSAAGGTAIATGVKTKNESIGVDPEGKEIDSMLDAFQKAGRKTGIISTNMVVDATPAAFGASTANRWAGTSDIAKQLLDHKLDVILGGGADYFNPGKQKGLDLLAKFKEAGYRFVSTKDELNAAPSSGRLLGLFHPGYMNFAQDKEELHSEEPSLAEMTVKAIDTLSKGGQGFFLMSEGAKIDHASHASDFPGIWRETIEFDKAVKAASDWASKRNDTLVVVLADHETMGISASEPMDIPSLKKIKVSPAYMAGQLPKKLTPKAIKRVFKTYADINLTNKEAQGFIKHTQPVKSGVYPQNRIQWEIGSLIASHYHAASAGRNIRLLSSTGGHTSNMVPVLAAGPGSERFTGVLDNTDVSRMMTQAAGVPFEPGKN